MLGLRHSKPHDEVDSKVKQMVRPNEFRELTHQELDWIGQQSTCPYCRGPLYEGPSGGMCTNLICKTQDCWSRFNYCGITGEYIGQELPMDHADHPVQRARQQAREGRYPNAGSVKEGQIYGDRLVVRAWRDPDGTPQVLYTALYRMDEKFFLETSGALHQ